MYKVVYSKFTKKWMVVGAGGLAQSSWNNRLEARATASSLNRRAYDHSSE